MKTLQDLARLRSQGVLLVLITGARSATLLQRLPFLPQADAYVCENGGRIFYAGSPLPTACPLTEDMAWRTSLSAAGELSLPSSRFSHVPSLAFLVLNFLSSLPCSLYVLASCSSVTAIYPSLVITLCPSFNSTQCSRLAGPLQHQSTGRTCYWCASMSPLPSSS